MTTEIVDKPQISKGPTLGFMPTRGPTPQESAEWLQANLPAREVQDAGKSLQRVRILVQMLPAQYGIEFLPSPQDGWAVTVAESTLSHVRDYILGKRSTLNDLPDDAFKVRQFLYSQTDIGTRPEEEVLGTAHHEIGHINRTKFRLLFEGQRLALEQGFIPSSYATFQNALEDVWVNIGEAESSPRVRQRIEANYQTWTHEVVVGAPKNPLLNQLGLSVIYYWLYGTEIPTVKDRRVKEAFAAIKDELPNFFWGASAEDNFKLFNEKIWPRIRHLEKYDVDDGVRQALADAALEDDDKASSKDILPKKLKEIFKKMFPKTHGPLPIDGKDKARIAEGLKPLIKDGKLPPPSEYPPELRKLLDDLLSSLPEKERERLRKEAEEDLDKRQTEILVKGPLTGQPEKDKNTGRYIILPPKELDPKELRKARKALQDAEDKDKSEQPPEPRPGDRGQPVQGKGGRGTKPEDLGFERDEKRLFDEYMAVEKSASLVTRELVREFRSNLPKTPERVWVAPKFAGPQVSAEHLPNEFLTGRGKLFKARDFKKGEEVQMALAVAVDNSLSMAEGEKLKGARVAMVSLSRLGRILNAASSLIAFDEGATLVKSFLQDLDNRAHRIKPKMMHSVTAEGGGTNMEAGMELAEEELRKSLRFSANALGILIVVSDSGATAGKTGAALREYVRELQKRYVVLNFILGATPEEVEAAKSLFGNKYVVPVDQPQALAYGAGRKLYQLKQEFEKKC